MPCSVPPPLSADQISVLIDGTATPEEHTHLSQCPYCSERLAQARALEQRLVTTLKRWDCPSTQQLGEYHLGVLSAVEERVVRRHLEECALCKAEVEELRQFLATAPDEQEQPQMILVPKTRPHTFGEVIARLIPQRSSLALRGSSREPIVAEADGTTVIVEIERTPNEQIVIVGQIAADEQDGWTGALVEVRQADLLMATARVDDLGGWQCGPLPIAPSTLRITPKEGNSIILPALILAS
ncbi:MAG: zf-HC2 domain-containing protein [Herpetosiphonaceae bacterium]|nr:zf-HC2 domain-containing protein [Herpetosiphonaceae bacterium]